MNASPIKPPNFDDITATILGPNGAVAQPPQDFTPRPEPSQQWSPPQVSNSAPRIDALTREVIINRELIRRHFQLSKGQLHEAVEAIKEDLFAPKSGADTAAVLAAVQQMLAAQRAEFEELLTAQAIRTRQQPEPEHERSVPAHGFPQARQEAEDKPYAYEPNPDVQEERAEPAQPEPIMEDGQIIRDPNATRFFGRIDLPESPSIQPVISTQELPEPRRPRRKSTPPRT